MGSTRAAVWRSPIPSPAAASLLRNTAASQLKDVVAWVTMSAIEAIVLERRAGAPLFHKAEPPDALKRNQSRC
jgi:hypothetical protein